MSVFQSGLNFSFPEYSTLDKILLLKEKKENGNQARYRVAEQGGGLEHLKAMYKTFPTAEEEAEDCSHQGLPTD